MILFNEIKKIFELKKILIVILISLIIYQMFIRFHIEYFPNGRPEFDHYNVSLKMIKEYETNMDSNEYEDFKKKYKEDVKKAEKYIQSEEIFAKAGITNYQDFRKDEGESENSKDLSSYVYFEKKLDLFWELQAREYMMERYEVEQIKSTNMNKKQLARVKEVKEGTDKNSILPYFVVYNYNEMIKFVTILILLSNMFIVSPIYISDKRNKLHYLQYTSKKGRDLFKIKMAAGLVSALIITTIQFICFFLIYSQNHIETYFNSSINSFFNDWISWYDITFIQYIILTVIVIYTLSLIITGLSMLLSSISPNYITVIGAHVPIAFLAFGLGTNYLLNQFTSIDLPQYFQPLAYAILLITVITLLVSRWKKEKVLNIIN